MIPTPQARSYGDVETDSKCSCRNKANLHVCPIEEGVEVCQSDWGFVLESSEKPLLYRSELLSMAAEELSTLCYVHSELGGCEKECVCMCTPQDGGGVWRIEQVCTL